MKFGSNLDEIFKNWSKLGSLKNSLVELINNSTLKFRFVLNLLAIFSQWMKLLR